MAKVKLSVSKLDLNSHEKGGQTLAKHIMTLDQLLAKLNYSRFGQISAFLSAYCSKVHAQFWTKAAIDLNNKSIAVWYKIVPDWDEKTSRIDSVAASSTASVASTDEPSQQRWVSHSVLMKKQFLVNG